LNVADAFNDNQTKLGDFRVSALNPVQTKTATTLDYGYDDNGNLVKDLNKDLVTYGGGNGIQYNYLNLPTTITVKKDAVSNKGTITYTYDAAGNKLKKQTIDYSTSGKTITTTTTYINGFVYESKITTPANTPNDDYTDKLQFIPDEEGRIRPTGNTSQPWAFDYFLKDHLGNVRMVLTDEVKTNLYSAATLEGTYDASTNSMVNFEKGFYRIDNTKITLETSIPSWGTETVANTKLYYNNNGNPPANTNYPAGCTPTQTAGSTKLYKLNGNSNQTGLELMIKVMAGDHIDIFGKSYYLNTTAITNNNSTTLNALTLMTDMLLAPGNAAAAKGISASQLNTINSSVIPSSFFRGSNSEPTTTIPKAYINYIFLDENFKYAGGGASRVGASGVVKDHWQSDVQLQNITVPKNGYIFVYVSNESNFDVFFDNLQVIHKPGPILEETHYYPFGLTMAGISSGAAGGLENKIKFQGQEFQHKEFSDGSGLEMYGFKYRMDDPQIGRFWQIDPLASKYVYNSTYAFSENKVTSYVELEGLEAVNPQYIIGQAKKELAAIFQYGADLIGRFSWNTGVTVKNDNQSKSVNLTVSSNSGATMSSIIQHNSNEGAPPLLKAKVKVESNKTLAKSDVNTPVVSGSQTTSQNQDGTQTSKTELKTQTPEGLTVGGAVSTSSNGNVTMAASVSASDGSTSAEAQASRTTNSSNGTDKFEVKIKLEQKIDNTSVSLHSSIIYNNN
jgi:RHS repeat-associated protein